MFIRIPHSAVVDAISTAEELYLSNAISRLSAIKEFDGEDLAKLLKLIDVAQHSTLNLYHACLRGMPTC